MPSLCVRARVHRPAQNFFIPDVDLAPHIDTYWRPFATCVGSFIEPLAHIPWFMSRENELRIASRHHQEYPFCSIATMHNEAKQLSSSAAMRFQWHDLHKRAGVHLIAAGHGQDMNPRCLVLATPKANPSAASVLTSDAATTDTDGINGGGDSHVPREEDVVWLDCFSFFRYYDHWNDRVDVVSVLHPLFNRTAAIVNAWPKLMNGVRVHEVDRSSMLPSGLKVFQERAFMYDIQGDIFSKETEGAR